jgi:hypothetical protein
VTLTYQERKDIISAINQWFAAWQRVLRDWSQPYEPPKRDNSLAESAAHLMRMDATKGCASQYLFATTQVDLQVATSCGIDALRSLEPER